MQYEVYTLPLTSGVITGEQSDFLNITTQQKKQADQQHLKHRKYNLKKDLNMTSPYFFTTESSSASLSYLHKYLQGY